MKKISHLLILIITFSCGQEQVQNSNLIDAATLINQTDGAEENKAPLINRLLTDPFTILKGQPHFVNESISIRYSPGRKNILLHIDLDLSENLIFPKVIVGDSLEEIEAKNMKVLVTGGTKDNPALVDLFNSGGFSSGIINLRFEITAEMLKPLAVGYHNFELDIKTGYFNTSFDDKPEVVPIAARIQFIYEVRPLIQTTLFIDSLILSSSNYDPSNDSYNPTPEAGIRLKYAGETIYFDYCKNSYVLHVNDSVVMQHNYMDDKVVIEIYDVDYGPNDDDFIGRTEIPIASIINDIFINIPISGTDKLTIRAKTIGQIN